MNKKEIPIRSSVTECLTYVTSIGELENSIEVRYEDEKYMACSENVGSNI